MSEDEDKQINLPGTIARDIWNAYHFSGMRVEEIKDLIRTKHYTTFDIRQIKSIIDDIDSWKKDKFAKAKYNSIGTTRKEWISTPSSPIDMINIGGKGAGGQWIPNTNLNMQPISIQPINIIFPDKKTKKTKSDVIKIFLAEDCEYCLYAKRKGIYDEALKHINQKYGKYYHVREVLTSGNPTEGLKNPETREMALYYLKEMGATKGIFDFYFPAFYMQGNSWGVFAQYRLGIHLKLLFEAIDLIHTQKLLPENRLSPPFHTGKFMEIFGFGTKKGIKKTYKEMHS